MMSTAPRHPFFYEAVRHNVKHDFIWKVRDVPYNLFLRGPGSLNPLNQCRRVHPIRVNACEGENGKEHGAYYNVGVYWSIFRDSDVGSIPRFPTNSQS